MSVKIKFWSERALMVLAVMGIAGTSYGRATVRPGDDTKRKVDKTSLLRTAANCNEGQDKEFLDINNVRAMIMTGGDMWWDRGTTNASYEVPKGSGKHALYAGALWVGGYDTQGQLKVTAQTYRQTGNDYWPGPLSSDASNNTIDQATCSAWDYLWKVNKSDIIRFNELIAGGNEDAVADPVFNVIKYWPASGNVNAQGANGTNLFSTMVPGRNYAPYVDVDGVPGYDWRGGDYPDINGDQYIFRVYNDMGNTKSQTGSLGIGLEVQGSAFAYATKDYLNDATFYNYRLINRGSLTMDSTYTATWTDADLGFACDDYIGCDTGRGLGILYNSSTTDGSGQSNSYGSQVPMVGVDFFIGPARITYDTDSNKWDTLRLKMSNFTYFSNSGCQGSISGPPPDEITDPDNAIEFYRYMTGSNKLGNPFTYDFQGTRTPTKGYGGGPSTNSVFFGEVNSGWSECFCNNPAYDRRFIHSAGPFKLTGGGVTNDITIGVVWVADVGGCPNTSFGKIRLADDAIQELFDNNFKTIEGPESPRLVIREMDRKLIFYMLNDSNSTNYREQYGYSPDPKYRVYSSKATKLGYTQEQAIYKFEGYRVFQLKNSEVQPAQIFGENGEVDNNVAVEVFQCDIKNGITEVWSHERDARSTNEIHPVLKVKGQDKGIVHSFELTTDAFASGDDKQLVNYRTYRYVAIAYGVNNFRPYKDGLIDSTQDKPYLESAHSAGGKPIPIYTPMPNPANGDMGTVVNSDYGMGVKVTRIEGTGNGGNILQMDKASEELAVAGPGYHAKNPTYEPSAGPVNVKVIDPVKIKPMDWEIFLRGAQLSPAARGINPDSGTWELRGSNGSESVTIFSESNIRILNEQILEKYGLSVNIAQTVRPGDDQPSGNGYITSDITYVENSKTWLAGVQDEEDRSYQNWILSGNHTENPTPPPPCNWNDKSSDTLSFYEDMINNNTLVQKTWAPYPLAADDSRTVCGFGVAKNGSQPGNLFELQSVDLVFTSDKSKWTRCMVVETQDDATLSEGKKNKFLLREHAGWNLEYNGNQPIYSSNPDDVGMSWFPGYAINQETGERLNIFFGEDSWQKSQNGADMLWNPTSTLFTAFGEPSFGGKHYVYIANTRYDECRAFRQKLLTPGVTQLEPFSATMWVGTPMLRIGGSFLSIEKGMIPTETRLRFRVTRPYARYTPDASVPLRNNALPLYSFSTKQYAPVPLDQAGNPYNSDKQRLLDQIFVVPNPYYAYNNYEGSRLDSRVRIINLPRKATISIYSLDGSLIRQLSKDNANVSFIDWDTRNAKGLPIASGMYLVHVKADNIGETVIRWFGAMKPIDITNF